MQWYELLFNSNDGVCSGNAYETKVNTGRSFGEFFSINPLDANKDHGYFLKDKYDEFKPRRADLNVSCFRNFMFEMDSVPLEDQLKIFQECGLPWATITYSGGKSMHAILSVDGGLNTDLHCPKGLDDYAVAWKRIAAKIDRAATRMGYMYPEGKSSFLDHATRNPSRFSRTPGFVRSNGNEQKLVHLGDRITRDKFYELLETCPMVEARLKADFDAPEEEVTIMENFEAILPSSLNLQLKCPDWAGRDGNYEHLFRLACWAIDDTNVSYDAFMEFMYKYTFKILIRLGYPKHKLEVGIDHAFRYKGKK